MKPRTFGEWKESGYRPRGVKEELRENLRRALAAGENPVEGIHGYERTGLPSLHNAILSRHDFLLLGLRGQAKTRLLRMLINLLDPEIPAIAGSELNEDPFEPITKYGRRVLQIRGVPIRIPLDILLVFSANPADYTNRGNIITPLKDRISSQIVTHYPDDVKTAAKITAQEAWLEREQEPRAEIPDFFRELVEEVAFAARSSEFVDQSSGVSARMPISAIEILVSNLERRGLKHGENRVAPRLCDLPATLPAITGKVEMVYEGEQQGAEVVAKRLIGAAVKKLFDARFPAPDSGRPTQRRREEPDESPEDTAPIRRARSNPAPEKIHPLYEPIVEWFAAGNKITLSDDTPFPEHLAALESVPGLRRAVEEHFAPASVEERSVGMELVLEGLTQHLKIAREDLDSKVSYTEMLKFNLVRSRTS